MLNEGKPKYAQGSGPSELGFDSKMRDSPEGDALVADSLQRARLASVCGLRIPAESRRRYL